MTNTVLITRKTIDPFQMTQLRRDGHDVRVLHIFEPCADQGQLALLNRMPWVGKILLEDDLYGEFSKLFELPVSRLGNFVYTNPPAANFLQGLEPPEGEVLFVPCNDTHVKMMLPMAAKLPRHSFLVVRGENAEKYLDEHAEPFVRMSLKDFQGPKFQRPLAEMFQRRNISAVVVANDWTGENWRICELARLCGIPSICVQEGPQDFELEGGWQMQMQYADYILLQGLSTLPYLNASRFVITGNPRLSTYSPIPLPDPPVVMLNSNFTYGVCEEARDMWIADCVETCLGLSVDYFISKHPRDTGDLSAYKVINSDAFRLPDQLAQCNVVITRFSQVVHEAMLSGRQVIYYNPHGEVKRVQTEDDTGGFFHARDKESLRVALQAALLRDFPNAEARNRCNLYHCGPCDGKEIDRCVWAISQISMQNKEAPRLLLSRPPWMRDIIRRIRRRIGD